MFDPRRLYRRLADHACTCCFGAQGFTLIEIIMVLVLLGIMGVGAGLGLSQVIRGYLFTKDAAETMGKAQVALLRLSKEFRVITEVSSGTASALSFSAQHGATLTKSYTVSLPVGSNAVKLSDGTNNDTLVDRVNAFVLNYYDTYSGAASTTWLSSTKIIEVVLTMNGPDGVPVVFTTRVAPRNIAN